MAEKKPKVTITFKKPTKWAHRGVEVVEYAKGQTIDTDDEDLVRVACDEEGWATRGKGGKAEGGAGGKGGDKPTRADLDKALGELPGDYDSADQAVTALRKQFGELFTEDDEKRVRELSKA